MKGLEPPRPKAQDPKSCAATNYATSAWRISPYKKDCKVTIFSDCYFKDAKAAS
jgi:hypothetical protein